MEFVKWYTWGGKSQEESTYNMQNKIGTSYHCIFRLKESELTNLDDITKQEYLKDMTEEGNINLRLSTDSKEEFDKECISLFTKLISE